MHKKRAIKIATIVLGIALIMLTLHTAGPALLNAVLVMHGVR